MNRRGAGSRLMRSSLNASGDKNNTDKYSVKQSKYSFIKRIVIFLTISILSAIVYSTSILDVVRNDESILEHQAKPMPTFSSDGKPREKLHLSNDETPVVFSKRSNSNEKTNNSPNLYFRAELDKDVNELGAPEKSIINDSSEKISSPNSNTPILILHVGPPKAGSTSIQCNLVSNADLLSKRDNYHYIGKSCGTSKRFLPIQFIPRELNGMERKNSQLKKLEEVVKKHIDAGHNMIMSSESFAHKDESYWITEKSAKFLQEIFPGYHIEVVVSYRRMSDFVHSRYPTLFNGYGKNKQYLRDTWPQKDLIINADYREDFSRLPTVSSYLYSILSSTPEGLSYDKTADNSYEEWMEIHPSVRAYHQYIKFFNVTVLNMHMSEDYFTNFICNALPSSSYSCKFLRKKKHKSWIARGKDYRISMNNYDTDRLAVALFDKGIIKNTQVSRASRKEVTESLLSYSSNSSTVDGQIETVASILGNGSRICPSDSLVGRLVNITLAIEMYLCRDWFISNDGIRSRGKFLDEMSDPSSKKRDKFCNADVNDVTSRDVAKWKDILGRNRI